MIDLFACTESVNHVQRVVKQGLPGVKIEIGDPVSPKGTWQLDCTHEGRHVAVQIEAPDKIGVTILTGENDYGLEADEYYTTPVEAAQRVLTALTLVKS